MEQLLGFSWLPFSHSVHRQQDGNRRRPANWRRTGVLGLSTDLGEAAAISLLRVARDFDTDVILSNGSILAVC